MAVESAAIESGNSWKGDVGAGEFVVVGPGTEGFGASNGG